MLAVLGIYGLGIALCLLAGVAARALLTPRGAWVRYDTIPLGLCVLMALMYPLGIVMSAQVAAPLVVAALVVALVSGALIRRRTTDPPAATPARALMPTASAAIAIGLGIALGCLLLVPTMRQGFPTTIAATNNDGWGYSGMVDWLTSHPFPRDVQPNIAEPMTLVPWNQNTNDFAVGFEYFASMLASLLGRAGYEVVNSAAAVGLAAAVGGWSALLARVRGGVGATQALLVGVAVVSPLVVLPFAENYMTQFVSICLWPFAIASFIRLADRPDIRGLGLAALASAGLIGTYPALTPWLVPPLVAVALLGGGGEGWRGTVLERFVGRRVVGAAVLLAALAAATTVIAPIQVIRGIRNVLFLDSAVVGAVGDFFSNGAYAALVVGATNPLGLFPRGPLGWSIIGAIIMLVVVYVVAFAPLWTRGRHRWTILGLAAGLLLTTVLVVIQYRIREEYAYQVYKGLISGGALLAGVAVVALLLRAQPGGRAVRAVALGCCAALWIPSSAALLQASADNTTGFRSAEVQLGRALDRLPAGSTVLAEGAAPDAHSFQLRMMSAYFGGQDDLRMEGLGNTASYLTPGGLDDWRPTEPWDEVLRTGPQPVTTARREIWSNGAYTLERSPTVDVSTFGLGWYPPEGDGATLAWTSGPADILVSNDGPTARRVRLGMTVASYAVPRTMTLTAPGRRLRVKLAPDTFTPVAMPLRLPPESVTTVRLSAGPGAVAAPAGDARRLMIRVEDLHIAG